MRARRTSLAADNAAVQVTTSSSSTQRRPLRKVNDETEDPQAVAEYAHDIFALHLEKEALLPRSTYMEHQADINGRMLAILFDWLIEVHMKYQMRIETLYLTISIIDRYLAQRVVMRRKLQLLGVVAMLIASKYEEIDPQKAHVFAYITDGTYTKREILDMEARVLVTLGFSVAVPTPAHFLDRIMRANECDNYHKAMVNYILELSLLDSRTFRHEPSLLVSAAVCLSNEVLGRQQLWPVHLLQCTGRTETSLRTCIDEMRNLLVADRQPDRTLQAVRRKYQSEANYKVASHASGDARMCRPRA